VAQEAAPLIASASFELKGLGISLGPTITRFYDQLADVFPGVVQFGLEGIPVSGLESLLQALRGGPSPFFIR
jgi:hypothetical protein